MKDAPKNVFFINEISLEEEYHLIFPREKRDKRGTITQKIFGNKLLPTFDNLRETNFVLEERKEYSEGVAELVLLSLLNNRIFYNFIIDLKEKINRKLVYTPFINNLINYLGYGHKSDFLDIKEDPIDIFEMICKKIHEDLTETHYFEEESWTSKTKKNYKFEKKIFEKYSPIVEIFHGKYEGQENRTFYKIYRDYLGIELKDDVSDVSKGLQDYISSEEVEVNKSPLILILKFNNKKKLALQNNILLKKKKYSLTGFITRTDSSFSAHLNNQGKWYTCANGKIKRTDREEQKDFFVAIAFYQIERIMN